MVSMSSTLVETVSINYEDFNESFLTCGTCLCMYDGGEHTPKLLCCSHTVCLHCLTRIAGAASQSQAGTARGSQPGAQPPPPATFRCPICRECITVPRGGVAALPPSFLVNQLLDLMARQRREVVPKCSVHLNQELLFCETCDMVFCAQCVGGNGTSHVTAAAAAANGTSSSTCEHTVIPFSIAIKRMSEILLYKANECISKLTAAEETVNGELQRLEQATQTCLEGLKATFEEISSAVEMRRVELSQAIEEARDAKKKVLREQLALIEAEKDRVTSECNDVQYLVEVRNITQRIGALGDQLESASQLAEPRENAFVACELAAHTQANLSQALARLGRVRTSTTLPSLSTLQVREPCIVNLETTAILSTVDYHGAARTNGGDPITAQVTRLSEAEQNNANTSATSHNEQHHAITIETEIVDNEDGTYFIRFRPNSAGKYQIKVTVLDRPVRHSPLTIDVSEHNNPLKVFGCRGSGKEEFLQPVAVAVNNDGGAVYVVDTGNSRVKVLTPDLHFIRHLECEGLTGRSCTGIAVNDSGGWLAIINWRSKLVTRLNHRGESLDSFTHEGFQEPIDIAIDSNYGHILVADNGPCCVYVFDTEGKLLFQVGKKGSHKGNFNLISSVTVGPGGEIIVADSRIQVFSAKGDFLQEIYSEGKGRGRYGGVAVDQDGMLVASRSEKGRNFIQVFQLSNGALLSVVDSHEAKLKRPSGLATTADRHVIVVDLGNDCVKKYRYW
ncbi:tripartite motif-containing protein 3 [Nilaparvata lugens]|uniref:tripartite motif-containing protein 3 n=1 Tax=Nilaparvata lugens TaxID=108931 RepID=UPI00193EAF99|nr:tripartite motif-containing protein 3 [Nilaparvata lugens]XP_039296683.1 tripartite motif-containing protein 3 [Nilaparvata lugens]